jgi:hypothetical protein
MFTPAYEAGHLAAQFGLNRIALFKRVLEPSTIIGSGGGIIGSASIIRWCLGV